MIQKVIYPIKLCKSGFKLQVENLMYLIQVIEYSQLSENLFDQKSTNMQADWSRRIPYAHWLSKIHRAHSSGSEYSSPLSSMYSYSHEYLEDGGVE